MPHLLRLASSCPWSSIAGIFFLAIADLAGLPFGGTFSRVQTCRPRGMFSVCHGSTS